MSYEPQNETNAMWRGFHKEMRKRSAVHRDWARTRIDQLEKAGSVIALWHTDFHVKLTNPETFTIVEFYPSRGTVVFEGRRQNAKGLQAALELIGVKS